jgi:hypothetical protein
VLLTQLFFLLSDDEVVAGSVVQRRCCHVSSSFRGPTSTLAARMINLFF